MNAMTAMVVAGLGIATAFAVVACKKVDQAVDPQTGQLPQGEEIGEIGFSRIGRFKDNELGIVCYTLRMSGAEGVSISCVQVYEPR